MPTIETGSVKPVFKWVFQIKIVLHFRCAAEHRPRNPRHMLNSVCGAELISSSASIVSLVMLLIRWHLELFLRKFTAEKLPIITVKLSLYS